MAEISHDGHHPQSSYPTSLLTSAEHKECGLYNGISNRARGWKSKSSGTEDPVRPLSSFDSCTKRWDGLTKICQPWDSLRRDPDLWFRIADCDVHLHTMDQTSGRGPSFRIPSSALFAAGCQPLLDQCLVSTRASTRPMCYHSGLSRQQTRRLRYELYIAPPADANPAGVYAYNIRTRNFFAWLLGKPLVGRILGSTMISLFQTLQEFRGHVVDNLGALLAYLESMGYFAMQGDAQFSIAALRFAEFFCIPELYTDAFAHCTGMSEKLLLTIEYQHASFASRKLIKQARCEMDQRLGTASQMLANLLQDELCDTRLGLPHAARAHLDRFRLFIRNFYAAIFGCYPPNPNSKIFDPAVLHKMNHDFHCLYRLLVDEQFKAGESSRFVAKGGLCTLQCVYSFDLQHGYISLPRPFPLLPLLPEMFQNRRKSWFARCDKPSLDAASQAQAALMHATNMTNFEVLDNELVGAYRRFEDNFAVEMSRKTRLGAVSHSDARKVRWIFIYAMHQILQNATIPPPGVRYMSDVPYHIAIWKRMSFPWMENRLCSNPPSSYQRHMQVNRTPARSVSGRPGTRPPIGPTKTHGRSFSMTAATPVGIETPQSGTCRVEPDINHFALTVKALSASNTPSRSSKGIRSVPNSPARTRSFTGTLSRSDTIRRSLSIFSRRSSRQSSRASSPTRETSVATIPSRQRSTSYHEIIVDSYGNGTQSPTSCQLRDSSMTSQNAATTIRTPSNASTASSDSKVSNVTAATTISSSSTVKSTASSAKKRQQLRKATPVRQSLLDVADLSPASVQPGRPTSMLVPPSLVASKAESLDCTLKLGEPALIAKVQQQVLPGRHSTIVTRPRPRISDRPRSISYDAGQTVIAQRPTRLVVPTPPSTPNLQRGSITPPEPLPANSKYVNVRADDDIRPMWEQYTDLGGLTEIS